MVKVEQASPHTGVSRGVRETTRFGLPQKQAADSATDYIRALPLKQIYYYPSTIIVPPNLSNSRGLHFTRFMDHNQHNHCFSEERTDHVILLIAI